jgi:hypothetical protein
MKGAYRSDAVCPGERRERRQRQRLAIEEGRNMQQVNAAATAPHRTTGVRQQNISLMPDDWRALRLLAARERNGNISAAVARMIDEAMTRSYGIDWRLQAPLAKFER